MGVIFSLSGSKAIGKTTLIRGLRRKLPDLVTRESFRQTDTGFDMTIEKEYYENQKWYIRREIEEYRAFRAGQNPVLLLRGPEDMVFYSLHYPVTKHFDWDVEANIGSELQALRQCRSDHILYLDAPLEVIMQRKEQDCTKPRKNMEDWLTNWQPYIEAYMKGIPYTKVFHTERLTADEVLEEVAAWMIEKLSRK